MCKTQAPAEKKRWLNNLDGFFEGKIYPLLVCLLVLAGHITSLELWLSIPNVLLVAVALVRGRSIRPFLPFALTLIYSVSTEHGPGTPNYSDYYFTGYRLPIVIILFAIIFGAMAIFAMKNRIFRDINLLKTPLLLPLLILSAAFLLNGAFSGNWDFSDLLMGLCEALIYTVLYLFFYFAIRGENREKLIDYIVYIGGVVAVLLILECGALFITSDGIFEGGSIIKEKVLLGWGIWNTIGVCLTVLIPLLFLGYLRSRHGLVYLGLATLTLLSAALTQSRNAILFGTIVYMICLGISLFYGKRRLHSVTFLGAILVVCGLADTFLGGKIAELLGDVLSRGFSDNGRFELWTKGIKGFLSAPIFGQGFFTSVSDSANFLPTMVHQTFIQILSAMGIFGLLAYLYYRVSSVLPLFKKPSMENTMLALSVGVLLAESLLDNFIFYFIPIILYSLLMAVIHREELES